MAMAVLVSLFSRSTVVIFLVLRRIGPALKVEAWVIVGRFLVVPVFFRMGSGPVITSFWSGLFCGVRIFGAAAVISVIGVVGSGFRRVTILRKLVILSLSGPVMRGLVVVLVRHAVISFWVIGPIVFIETTGLVVGIVGLGAVVIRPFWRVF